MSASVEMVSATDRKFGISVGGGGQKKNLTFPPNGYYFFLAISRKKGNLFFATHQEGEEEEKEKALSHGFLFEDRAKGKNKNGSDFWSLGVNGFFFLLKAYVTTILFFIPVIKAFCARKVRVNLRLPRM